MNPPVISAENEVAPTGALSTLFGRIFWRTTDRLQRGSAAKNKRRGTLLLCFEAYVFISENRKKRKTAHCSVPWQRRRQPDATKAATPHSTANLSRPRFFFLSKAMHVSYAVHSLEDVLVRVLFISPKSRGRSKKKLKSRKQKRNNQPHKQAVCTTTRTERCAHRTLAAKIPPARIQQAVYFSAFRGMLR